MQLCDLGTGFFSETFLAGSFTTMNVKQPDAIVSAYDGFGDDPAPEVQMQRPLGERLALHGANLQFLLTHDAPAAHRYQFDTAARQAVSGTIAPAAGVMSRDALPYRCAQSLARLRGRELHAFPGGHSGAVNRAQAFGEERRHVLAAGS